MLKKPDASINGLVFFPVPETSDREFQFGFEANRFFPRDQRPDVPRAYEELVDGWFFNGGAVPLFSPQVNREAAIRAIHAWMKSFNPPHESKISTVAYAVWVWTTLDEEE
jgi:hypothetical protein